MCFRTLTDLFNKYGKRWQVKIPHKYGGYFRNDADHRDYVGIGTAAGQCPLSNLCKRITAYLLVAFLLVEHLPWIHDLGLQLCFYISAFTSLEAAS